MSVSELIEPLCEHLDSGRPCLLATVIATWGSSPRPPGSCLLVGYMPEPEPPRLAGSVSGGCVEAAVVELGREVIEEGRARRVEYGVTDADARAVGLACGGRLEILLQPLADAATWRSLAGRLQGGRAAVLALRLDEPAAPILVDPEGFPATESGDCGAKADREGSTDGEGSTVSQATGLPETVVEVLRQAAVDHRPRVVELDDAPWAILPQQPDDRLILVGAGHIAQALCDLASQIRFRVTVVDPRGAFASAERFPRAESVHDAWPDVDSLSEYGLRDSSYLVALAHDPKIDDPALVAAVEVGARYVGALGSRRSHATRVERLRERGLSQEAIDRIHAPIGLDIGARTPAEIALSILAEMVACRRALDPGR